MADDPVVALVLIAGGAGYSVRKSSLQQDPPDPAPTAAQSMTGPNQTARSQKAPLSPLGDLSTFRTITQDTLDRLNAGDQAGATSRIGDLETEWDNAEARLRPRDKAEWTSIDGKIDHVLRELRATNPKTPNEKAALTALLGALR